jgi:hypothetical protein
VTPISSHITPGSVAITSGVWPDDQTSIEPVYYGVGSDLMTFVLTYHQHGAQKHPVEGWLKSLIEHPSEVLDTRRAPLVGACSSGRPARRQTFTTASAAT